MLWKKAQYIAEVLTLHATGKSDAEYDVDSSVGYTQSVKKTNVWKNVVYPEKKKEKWEGEGRKP